MSAKGEHRTAGASLLMRLQWAAAVAADPSIGDAAKALAVVLAYVLNWKTDTCFHSMATLGRLIGKKERSTRLAVRELEEGGWLECRQTKGRVTNVYAPIFERSVGYDPFTTATRHDDTGFTQHESTGLSRQEDAGIGTNPASVSPQPGKIESPTRHVPAAKQEENKNNSASGTAPDGAQALAVKRKLTREENASNAAEFARQMAAKGLKTAASKSEPVLMASAEQGEPVLATPGGAA